MGKYKGDILLFLKNQNAPFSAPPFLLAFLLESFARACARRFQAERKRSYRHWWLPEPRSASDRSRSCPWLLSREFACPCANYLFFIADNFTLAPCPSWSMAVKQ